MKQLKSNIYVKQSARTKIRMDGYGPEILAYQQLNVKRVTSSTLCLLPRVSLARLAVLPQETNKQNIMYMRRNNDANKLWEKWFHDNACVFYLL